MPGGVFFLEQDSKAMSCWQGSSQRASSEERILEGRFGGLHLSGCGFRLCTDSGRHRSFLSQILGLLHFCEGKWLAGSVLLCSPGSGAGVVSPEGGDGLLPSCPGPTW